MKVLIVFNHPAPYKVRMFNELSKYCDLTVIFERNKAKDRPDAFYNEKKYEFNSITLTDSYIGNEGSYSNRVRAFIKKHHKDYDFIIMNGYSHVAEIKAILYMIKHNIKYSLMINGGIEKTKESSLKKRLKNKLISNASFYMSPTNRSDNFLVFYNADKKNIYRYPYSNVSNCDISDIDIDKNTLRKKYNLPTDVRIFVNASQFIDRKNNLDLLKIFNGRNEFLLLIGDGKEKQTYENYISENNMRNVIIMPFQDRKKLFEIFSCCDTFITLAKEDIFGQTTIEALASGLPVISSNKVNSSDEYIKDGFNGFIIDINNLQAIPDLIEKSGNLLRKNAIFSVKDITIEQSAKRIYEILSEVSK